jgi:hypothetical protein
MTPNRSATGSSGDLCVSLKPARARKCPARSSPTLSRSLPKPARSSPAFSQSLPGPGEDLADLCTGLAGAGEELADLFMEPAGAGEGLADPFMELAGEFPPPQRGFTLLAGLGARSAALSEPSAAAGPEPAAATRALRILSLPMRSARVFRRDPNPERTYLRDAVLDTEVVLKLAQGVVEIACMTGVDLDERSEAERPVGGQLCEGGDQLIVAFVSIQMPVMALACQEALGRDRRRTDTVSFDDLSRQRP